MVTVISRFRVRNGMEEDVRLAFLNRPRLVENASGFRGIDVMTDATDPSIFLLLTRWTDEESFRTWHRSDSHHASHVFIPKGLKLDPAFTVLTVGHSIQPSEPIPTLRDAIANHWSALSEWLTNSEAVFALLLSPDGTIHERNRAAQRRFPLDLAATTAPTIWDYLVCSDTDQLRRRLSEPDAAHDASFLMNLSDGKQSPVSWEARLLRCDEFFLLLATVEQRHESIFQNQMLSLTNDLSLGIRGAAQTNRKLKLANETIELLARTDGLTGLANRRMLEEALSKEIARADRLTESLSVIFIDVDRFKPINDQHGHEAGDRVLAEIAAIFKNEIRSYAIAARFGGDEFVLLLPGTTQDGAIVIAERIQASVSALVVQGHPGQIAVSMGIAVFVPGETGEELIARADEALYRSKQKGGSRFEVA
jgi:diguanylate cyclase (GGDEF)-like protein